MQKAPPAKENSFEIGDQMQSLEALALDFHFALRNMKKKAGATCLVILILAVGVGCSGALFALVRAILLTKLPYFDPSRLVMVWSVNQAQSWQQEMMSLAELSDWQSTDIFEEVVGFVPSMTVITDPGEVEMVHGYSATPGLFQMLGTTPLLGRGFLPQEEVPNGDNRVVVLRYSLWQRRFGGDRRIIGRNIFIRDEPYTVVGVMPRDFIFFNRQSELLLPLGIDPRRFPDRKARGVRVMGRLKPGMRLEEAQARADAFSAQLRLLYPESNQSWSVRLSPLPQDTSATVAPALWLLLGAVGLLLIIACANISSLLLVQIISRGREFSVRSALGASRTRLIRQYLTETVVLAATGGTLGLLVCFLLVHYFQLIRPDPTSFGRYLIQLEYIRMDWSVVAFVCAVSALVCLSFGWIPALHASKSDVADSLKAHTSRTAGGRQVRRVQNALVIAEVALSLVLIFGAALLFRSFQNLYARGPGFDAKNVFSVYVALPDWQLSQIEPSRQDQVKVSLQDRLFERLAALPGVQSVAAVSHLPLAGFYVLTQFGIEGLAAARSPDDIPHAIVRAVSPAYFSTLKIPVLAGRAFSRADGLDSQPLVIINDAFARRYLATSNPIGSRISMSGQPGSPRWHSIIGVVGHEAVSTLGEKPVPIVYFSQTQWPWPSFHVLVRAASPASELLPLLRKEVSNINPKIPLYELHELEELVLDSTWRVRYAMLVLGGLAAMSLVLSSLGLYGVLSYVVTERTNEIGIRLALGATPQLIVRMVVFDGLRLALLGIGAGLISALILGRLLSSLLFGVQPADPLTLAVVTVILLCCGFVSSFLPARHAVRLEPTSALRWE